MPDTIFMLEYLNRIGVDINQFVDQKALSAEYYRRIYRLDARENIISQDGKPVGKASNPKHLH
ncbi:hypothetical protein [Endozoicomonas numazuensis]|uniref:hypothetical protein n=1 Tax=Endozoicomonas numazuensis TaxID=1137799 RepID=UPI0012683BB3|nr:hypothetical protein [Endozoicomonas numazuensis]